MALPYIWVWGEGEMRVAPAIGNRVHHQDLLDEILDTAPPKPGPQLSYGGGFFSESPFHAGIYNISYKWPFRGPWQPPSEEDLVYMIRRAIEEREAPAGVVAREFVREAEKKSEPEQNLGFLKDPHTELYPCAWEGGKMRHEVNKKLRYHILNQLEKTDMKDPDYWIYFTVLGSGACYNWDEDGDFDVHMWVDYQKFLEKNPELTMNVDDLVSEVRKNNQLVNNPSFAELGLSLQECEGKMQIQYYAEAGVGGEDDVKRIKPYAAYDMETDEWIVHPFPIEPRFYGDGFLMVYPRARQIATEAADLLENFERFRVDAMFWSALYQKYQNKRYRSQYEKSRKQAESFHAAVKALWDRLFTDRQKAYNEEGKGIQDERDLTNKLLEVWGIQQRLKMNARSTLPWEEQEIPPAPESEPEDQKTAEKRQTPTERWRAIQDKAQRLRQSGQVHLEHNLPNYVEGTVEGDHGTYITKIMRDSPTDKTITQWSCSCPWGQVSHGRTRQWQRFEGRFCSHALALLWESMTQPLDHQDEGETTPYRGQGERPRPTPPPQAPYVGPGGRSPFPPFRPEAPPTKAPGKPPAAPGGPIYIPPGVPGIPSPKKAPEPAAIPPPQEVQRGVTTPAIQSPIPGTPNNPSPPPPLPPAVRLGPGEVAPIPKVPGAPEPSQGAPGASPGGGPPPQKFNPTNPLQISMDDQFPGKLTAWKMASFVNGQTVRAVVPLVGTTRDQEQVRVPRNAVGEVLDSNDEQTVAIFPLHDSSYLEPHLVRVVTETRNLVKARGKPFGY